MKLIINYILLSLIIILSIGCEDNFSPIGEFNEEYVLNAILDCSNSRQQIRVLKSFPPNISENNAYENLVSGADVRVWYNDTVYVFNEEEIILNNGGKDIVYLNFDFKPDINKDLEIEVILPNGFNLKSVSKTPARLTFLSNGTKVIPPNSGNFINVQWQYPETNIYFHPRLRFKYSKRVDSIFVQYEKEIPLNYLEEGDSLKPMFPLPNRTEQVNYNIGSVQRALNIISEGDENKDDYSVFINAFIDVIVFDRNLSNYYSVTQKVSNDYSVTIDEPDYTNVDGGYGLFASYAMFSYPIKFQVSYINSFGYRAITN